MKSSSYIFYCDEDNSYCKSHWQNSFEIYPKYEFKQLRKLLAVELKETQKEKNVDNKLLHRNNYVISDSPIFNDINMKYQEEVHSNPFAMLLPEKYYQLNSSNILLQYFEGTPRITKTRIKNKYHNYERFEKDFKRNTVNDAVGYTPLPFDTQKEKKTMMRRSSDSLIRNINYQSLCPIKRVPVSLETVEFEYRPNHYIEVTCANRYSPNHSTNMDDKNKICSEAGFSCMQLNRTIHLIRRNKSVANECWESEIRVVPSTCECMWPKHYYGDILAYHESQKRLTKEFLPFLHAA